MKLDFIRPGKPVENAYVESFHSRFRDECLNEHYFLGLQEAQEIIEAWRAEYNGFRPHSALNYQTPEEFVARYEKQNRTQDNPGLSLYKWFKRGEGSHPIINNRFQRKTPAISFWTTQKTYSVLHNPTDKAKAEKVRLVIGRGFVEST